MAFCRATSALSTRAAFAERRTNCESRPITAASISAVAWSTSGLLDQVERELLPLRSEKLFMRDLRVL
jgi:hypothetical protein